MPQNSNLNVFPYFDDFNSEKNYQRVLFKPGTPIQARELTTAQSILQNQIEKFGFHFFKEGSLINGNISYKKNYTNVQINDTHLGIPVSEYIETLVGKRIQGQTSGIIAKVQNYITNIESEKSRFTLYIRYISSDSTNFVKSNFLDGENLILLDDISDSNSIIRIGGTFATTINNNSSSIGSAVKIEDGVYFIRGFFITVPTQTIILDQYTNTPSYRVGLSINEEFAVASNDYPDLYDNALGFSNYAAPGADRLIISTDLIKKDIDDFVDENFVELIRVRDGRLEKLVDSTSYSVIGDELARRTYDESGDYTVDPFKISVKESLNDRLDNNGAFLPGQQTRQGNLPSSSLACISISPGKAYVKGYEIETNSTLLDLEKPRTTEKINNENIELNLGDKILVNNVYGSIPLEFSDNSKVFMYDERTSTKGQSNGNLIGISRVYNFESRSTEYQGDKTQYYISLYDTQLFTKIKINSRLTLNTPIQIEGQNSGTTGFLYTNITDSDELLLYDVSGMFTRNETLKINGILSNVIITEIDDYKIENVHQITANENNSGIGTFTADTVLSRVNPLGTQPFTISSSSGISTITSSEVKFNILNLGDIVSYTKPEDNLPTYNRVIAIDQSNNSFEVESLVNVTEVCNGSLPNQELTGLNVGKVHTQFADNSSDFFTQLTNENISDVDLSGTTISIRKTFNSTVNSSTFTFNLEDNLLSFDSFDEENFNLTFINTGNVVPLLEFDNITFSLDRKEVTITGLMETGPVLFTSTCKINTISSRKKVFNRCSSLIVNKSNLITSGIGSTTLNDGLTYDLRYGKRIQDKEISLDIADVSEILAIYESTNLENPKTPTLNLGDLSSNILNAIKGEKIIGLTGNAVGYFIQNLDNTKIEYVELNENSFILGEQIIFEESGITATVNEFTLGDKNVTNAYRLDNGYRKTYLDFSRIIRNSKFSAPTRKIRIIYNNYIIPSGASGDFITVNSYDADRYQKDLPRSNRLYVSDIIDFRPIVSPYSGNNSPFESKSRIFTDSSNSSPHIFSRNTTLNVSYNYYLPRVDKLFLYKDGRFILSNGVPSRKPNPPQNIEDALEIATLNIPAYLRNVNDIDIILNENKRYTMKDISRLENRIDIIQNYTLLTLLEQDAKNLTIRDEETRLDKFKSGFFVDAFKSLDSSDIDNVDYSAAIDEENGILRPSVYKNELDLDLSIPGISTSGTELLEGNDFDVLFNSRSNGVKKIGNVICLDYIDTEYIKNIFATQSTNIDSNAGSKWIGTIKLSPTNDNWAITKAKAQRTGIKIKDIVYMRSRNISINSKRLKANTNFNAFFDNIDVTRYVVPKLIEIEMKSGGTFQEGETVIGKVNKQILIKFKLKAPNHKSDAKGTDPAEFYTNNIYNNKEILPTSYQSTSTVLNVDILSLQLMGESSDFSGYIRSGMRLVGTTSRATATVKNIRLLSDEVGEFNGSFFIPDPEETSSPKFEIGTKEFILTTDSTSISSKDTDSYAVATYTAEPSRNRREKSIEPTRTPEETIIKRRILRRLSRVADSNPLAQSFIVTEIPGIYVTKCEVFFEQKDSTFPVTIQIREVSLGIPTQSILPYSEVTLSPNKIRKSSDATIGTIFNFESPVYLEGDKEYAIVLITESSNYKVWISKMGQVDVKSKASSARSEVIVSQQPILGMLYRAQSGSTSEWTGYQDEDMKLTLYRAKFDRQKPGTVRFYNPDLNFKNYGISNLGDNPIYSYSRKGVVSVGKSFTNSDIDELIPGATITQQQNSYFRADLLSISGSIGIGSTLSIVENASGEFGNRTIVYTDVDLLSLTGYGSGARADVSVQSGIAVGVTITQGGYGYVIGDTLSINTNSTSGLGKELILTIPNRVGIISSYNSLILDNIQGELSVNTANNLLSNDYVIQSSPIISQLNIIDDGLHLKIFQENHGMYSYENSITLTGILPDVLPAKLTSNFGQTDTTVSITPERIVDMLTFENLPVSPSNPGYILINNEIIRYTGINQINNTLTGATRDFNNFNASEDPLIREYYFYQDHKIGDDVFKYEFGGVSLRRINATHNLASVDKLKYPIDIDSYHIKLNMTSSSSKERNTTSPLFFNESKFGGTIGPVSVNNSRSKFWPKASKNILMTSIEPIVENITPEDTRISARIRTTSGTSVNGNEISFIDAGFKNITLDSETDFDSPRIIASKINETQYLENLPNKKSFTLELELDTNNNLVSPIIDVEGVRVITSMNRLDSPVIDYSLDKRVNEVGSDPHAAVYVSKVINLESPAEDLRVYFDAYRHSTNDIRVAYRLIRDNSPIENSGYELFPGYRNLDQFKNRLKNKRNNDGLPDSLTGSSISLTDYKSYEYTAKDIPEFVGFQIKIMMSGTSQINIPLIKNLRVVASV